MSTQYTVTFINQSQFSGTVMIFQNPPGTSETDLLPLAWLVNPAPADPTISQQFQWSINYGFFWSQTTDLAPGAVVTSAAQVNADLQTANSTTLSPYEGLYQFSQPVAAEPYDSLIINQAEGIGSGKVSIGCTMQNQPVFATLAYQNFTLTVTPDPTYYIAVGSFTQGQVLQTQDISLVGELQFNGTTSLTATFTSGNTWLIEPTTATNARFLAQQDDPASGLVQYGRWGRL